MDDKPRPSLEDLDSRLRKARGDDEPGNRGRLPGTRLGQALHLAIEMAAALAVGGGLGWLLDGWLGTKPWLFVVFIFVGIAAGILNAFRAAQRMGATPMSRADAGRRGDRGDGATGATTPRATTDGTGEARSRTASGNDG